MRTGLLTFGAVDPVGPDGRVPGVDISLGPATTSLPALQPCYSCLAFPLQYSIRPVSTRALTPKTRSKAVAWPR